MKVVLKLTLNLILLSGSVLLVRHGYTLFTTHNEPLKNSLILIGGCILWWLTLKLNGTRLLRRLKPGLFLTAILALVIFSVFAFAGVEPITSYKNSIMDKINTFRTEQQIKSEERLIAEKNREALIESEKKTTGVATEYNFYKEYTALFNSFRTDNNKQPLKFDPALNKIASQRVVEISQYGNFNHEGIKRYNLGENIAMMAYSSDSAETLLQQWATSSGHRANMLSNQYHNTGFAKNGKYAVQVFN